MCIVWVVLEIGFSMTGDDLGSFYYELLVWMYMIIDKLISLEQFDFATLLLICAHSIL